MYCFQIRTEHGNGWLGHPVVNRIILVAGHGTSGYVYVSYQSGEELMRIASLIVVRRI